MESRKWRPLRQGQGGPFAKITQGELVANMAQGKSASEGEQKGTRPALLIPGEVMEVVHDCAA